MYTMTADRSTWNSYEVWTDKPHHRDAVCIERYKSGTPQYLGDALDTLVSEIQGRPNTTRVVIVRNAKGHWLVAVHNIGGHVRIADTIQQFARH